MHKLQRQHEQTINRGHKGNNNPPPRENVTMFLSLARDRNVLKCAQCPTTTKRDEDFHPGWHFEMPSLAA